MRPGCLSVSRAEDGRIYRRKLTSLAFKGEDDPTGVPATWIVGEPVERAIQILERLQAGRDTCLFARIPGSWHDLRSHATGAKSTQQTNDDLAAFTDWVNTFCQQHGRPDGIPLVNGRRWRLSTSQFRRTLAWFIARQPGGSSPDQWPTGITVSRCSKATPSLGNCISRERNRRSRGQRGTDRDVGPP